MFRRSILLALAVSVAVVALASPAASARPGQALPCTTPELSGPMIVQVGDTYVVEGCGFAPGSWVPIEITEAGGCCLALNVLADERGGFSITRTAYAAGDYRVRAGQTRHNGRSFVAAEWHFKAG